MWNSYYGSYDDALPLSGCDVAHTWIVTGTKLTWCKVCDIDGHYDGTFGKYVVTKDRTKERKFNSYTDMD